jgi:uncharacterized protein DUF1259
VLAKHKVAGSTPVTRSREFRPLARFGSALTSAGPAERTRSHMAHEEPRITFLHHWGKGSSEELARSIEAARVTHQ